MKPFASYHGTTDHDGRFSKLKHPGKKPGRWRVNLWVITRNGSNFSNEITNREPCRFNDMLQGTVLPAVNEIIDDANQDGGAKKYGFNCYHWS